MTKILENWDVGSLYPNLIRIFGYSSRNQKDKQAYVDLLLMRMKAKHNQLTDDFLKPLGLTNGDLKIGLKLPLNAYSGALRAKFNALYDPVQGFNICATGQMLILQLIHNLREVPTLELVSANTDAVMYMIEDSHKEEAHIILHNWEKLTGLELEEDKIVKIIMRDVNNYVSINQVGDNDYEIHYKGGVFTGEHKFKWDKEKRKFNYKFEDSLDSNSFTIIAEAVLKNLLFDTPVEDVINNCTDIFRFQMISHMGSTYVRMIQRFPDGDVELQHNNRIYAGLQPTGIIYKIKSNGREDSLANQPTNPIIDNKNELTIDKIDKKWYINIAKQKINDFKGVKRLKAYKKEELLEYCKEHNIPTDKKMKKDDIIKIIEDMQDKKEECKEEIKEMKNVYQKINELRRTVREHQFVMDRELPTNLGGGEYASIGQYYDVIQDSCVRLGLDFSWEALEVTNFERGLFKPQGKPEQHVWTVKCLATFTDIETGETKTYTEIASGSDIADKGVSGASTLAFRNWFDKNFSPKSNDDENPISDEPKTEVPKVPTYIPPEKKEAIKEKVVAEPQKQDSDVEKGQVIAERIMKIRDLLGNDSYGASVIAAILKENYTSADIMSWNLTTQNKLDSLTKDM